MSKPDSVIDLKKYLSVISILGFLGVILVSFGWNAGKWIDASLYLIIGVALMVAGGIRMFFNYFEDGLTTQEITLILTDIIGMISFLSGLSILLELSSPIILGTRVIVAILAIIIIASDLFTKPGKQKRVVKK